MVEGFLNVALVIIQTESNSADCKVESVKN